MVVNAETKALLRDLIIELRGLKAVLGDLLEELQAPPPVPARPKSLKVPLFTDLKSPSCDCVIDAYCEKCMPSRSRRPAPPVVSSRVLRRKLKRRP